MGVIRETLCEHHRRVSLLSLVSAAEHSLLPRISWTYADFKSSLTEISTSYSYSYGNTHREAGLCVENRAACCTLPSSHCLSHFYKSAEFLPLLSNNYAGEILQNNLLSFSSSTRVCYFLLSFTTFYQGNWQEKPLSICALLKSFPWLISQIITLHTDIFLCRFYSQNTPAACRWSHHLLQYSQMSSCFTG